MKKLTYRIRNFFGFSKSETNGFIFLIVIMVLLLMCPWLFDFFYRIPNSPDHDNKKLDSLIAILTSTTQHKRNYLSPETFNNFALSDFNPNTASESELAQLVGKKIAGTIVRYRAKGGIFFTKKDFAKIYGVDSLIYARVEKFILLPEGFSKDRNEEVKTARAIFSITPFNINNADTIELQKVKGIGKVLSARIIKYRNRLGGFISEDQYQEIFGLDTLVIAELKKLSFILEDFVPVKMNINRLTIADLAAHPYIRKKYSAAIVNYRDQHKEFSSVDELKLIRSIPESELWRMLPYLDI